MQNPFRHISAIVKISTYSFGFSCSDFGVVQNQIRYCRSIKYNKGPSYTVYFHCNPEKSYCNYRECYAEHCSIYYLAKKKRGTLPYPTLFPKFFYYEELIIDHDGISIQWDSLLSQSPWPSFPAWIDREN